VANIATKQKANEVSLPDRVLRLNELVDEANSDKKKVAQLRHYLNQNPDLPGKLETIAATIRTNLIEKVVGAAAGSRLFVEQQMRALEDRLRGEEPTEIERLLIEAVLCCWLRLQHSENAKTHLMNGEHRFVDMEFADKMLSNAHRRYLRALTALAKVQVLNARKKKKDIKLKQVGNKWQ
jgi:hypothetical protein